MCGSHCCCSLSTQLQAYALGEMSKGEHLGYYRQGCAKDVAILSLKDESSAVRIYRIFLNTGFIFLVIFTFMAHVVLLQVLLKALSQKMETCSYSFDYYGIFWGLSAILCMVLIVLMYRDITHVSLINFNPAFQQAKYVRYIWPFLLAFPIIFCAPVAIYFGVKFKLTTPSVYLLSAKLVCCCNEKYAQPLVVSLTLWFNLVAAQYIVGHGVLVLFAFPVAPFVVAENVIMLLLSFMCLTYVMALVFTVCAFIGTRRCLRSNSDCVAMVRAAMLIPLLLAVICFSFVAALNGKFVNTATQQNSFQIILKSLFTPVLLTTVSLGLKRFVSVWMHWSSSGVEVDNAVNPLRGHGCNRYQALDNVVVDNVH